MLTQSREFGTRYGFVGCERFPVSGGLLWESTDCGMISQRFSFLLFSPFGFSERENPPTKGVFSMTTPLPWLLSICAAFVADNSALELRYKGTLEQVSRTKANVEVKQFDLYCLIQEEAQGAKLAYLVDERGGGGWAWPERFGEIALNKTFQPVGDAQIRVLHNHEGTHYPLPLNQPLFEHADKLNADAVFTVNKKRYEVVKSTKRQARPCWEVDVFTNIGKRQTLWVEEDTGLLVAMKSKVTMGRGDSFDMMMELDSVKELTPQKLASLKNSLAGLLQLQKDLKRKKDATKPELTKEQLAATSKGLEALIKDADGTPFQGLVKVINQDLKLQTQRDGDVEALAKRIIGKDAPAFELQDLYGKPVQSKAFDNQIVVLHFWKYHDSPLTEPYGQVAYLDFLHNKRKKLGVSVLGVAVDPRTDKEAELKTATRDFKKFRDFMNLSYPIAINSGSILKSLGDPRTVQAALPLWVVIDHNGKVVHYKSGYYEIHPQKGLEELDNVVIPLIRERRAEAVKDSK